MRRVLLGVLVVTAGVISSTSWSTASMVAASRRAAALPVVRCPTDFGISGPPARTPMTLSISSSSATRGLVAYTNTEIYLIGPRGMRCSGLLANDGGSQVIAWPQHQSRPTHHAHTDGLTLDLDPACSGCKAKDACPFFTAFARRLGFPCASGGPDLASGVVGYSGSPENGLVYRATCTLPASDDSICTISVNDVIRRYG